jgi:Flp pilus assembly protein TadB
MDPASSRRALQWVVRGLALVPIVVGAVTLVGGTRTVTDRGEPTASVESEFHFFGAWWMGAGLFLFSLANRIEERTREVQVFAALLVLAASGRVVAIIDVGWPKPLHIALMVIEFLLAAVLVVWQSRVARASRLAEAVS